MCRVRLTSVWICSLTSVELQSHSDSLPSVYNQDKCQIEMHIESICAQSVRLGALDHTIHFSAGDRILSEISRKFKIKTLSKLLSRHNLPVSQVFVDSNRWYALLLCQSAAHTQ